MSPISVLMSRLSFSKSLSPDSIDETDPASEPTPLILSLVFCKIAGIYLIFATYAALKISRNSIAHEFSVETGDRQRDSSCTPGISVAEMEAHHLQVISVQVVLIVKQGVVHWTRGTLMNIRLITSVFKIPGFPEMSLGTSHRATCW